MSIQPELLLQMLQSLVRIDSRNPGLEAGAPGELEIAIFVKALLETWDWVTELHDLGERRANVVARREGRGAGPSLMVNVHLDTVGTAGMDDPFSGELRDGRVWGRGAQDTKGGVAAVLAMAQALSASGIALEGDLLLAFVADEEHESMGTADLLRHIRTDAAIVIEPSDLQVIVGHRGYGIFRIRTRGRMAHGGRPDLGIDANLLMGHVLVELDRLGQSWRAGRSHPHLGPASLHVPVIAGGRHLFVYADECCIDVECRVIPGQSATEVLAALERLCAGLRDRLAHFDASIEPIIWRSAHEIDPERPIVQSLVSAASMVRGQVPQTAWHGWWEDSGLLGEAGIDAVVIGPTGGGLHSEQEWVEVDSVIELAEILRRAVLQYCGAREKGKQHE